MGKAAPETLRSNKSVCASEGALVLAWSLQALPPPPAMSLGDSDGIWALQGGSQHSCARQRETHSPGRLSWTSAGGGLLRASMDHIGVICPSGVAQPLSPSIHILRSPTQLLRPVLDVHPLRHPSSFIFTLLSLRSAAEYAIRHSGPTTGLLWPCHSRSWICYHACARVWGTPATWPTSRGRSPVVAVVLCCRH